MTSNTALIATTCVLMGGLLALPADAVERLIARQTTTAPLLDGLNDDPAWLTATAVTAIDPIANIPIILRSVYDEQRLYLLVEYPDPSPNLKHRELIWDPQSQRYLEGPTREDSLVIKWNLSPYPVDLTLTGNQDYRADVWFWKAARTHPAGYADDKHHLYSSTRSLRDSKPILTSSGKVFYLARNGDHGKPAYQRVLYDGYQGDNKPLFTSQKPTGSRADIQAQAAWSNGRWVIELQRNLTTDDSNDVQFEKDKPYLFGISRYAISGYPPTPELEQPLYGSGDIHETFQLILSNDMNN